MVESEQNGRENRKEGRISERSLREMHGKHTNTLIFQKEKISFNNNYIHHSTSVLLKDKEKRRREEETRRGNCPRMGSYAVRGVVLTPFVNSVTVVD